MILSSARFSRSMKPAVTGSEIFGNISRHYAITATPVTMAVKAHLRNNKPVVIGISTNDGLGTNAKNLGMLLNMKHFYFVPFGQDDPVKKEKSIVFKNDRFIDTLIKALEGKQLQPLLV